MTALILLPLPQRITYLDGAHQLTQGKLIAISSPELLFSAQRAQRALAGVGLRWEIVADSAALPSALIGLRLQSGAMNSTNRVSSDNHSYQLLIPSGTEAITVTAATRESFWHGVCTLVQVIQQRGANLPCVHIDDWPDFPRRGVMLDISRDRVPTMETLYALIDRLASWKINEFQLYTEHTFAYRKHQKVWANASPMTGEQIMALDQYCRERFIDLVPNQNSFGHMHRWLMHPEYVHLAETPEGLDWPFFLTPRPFSIAPAVPESIQFIGSLYDELLPHFSSRYVNVGCDETFDLGKGRSKALVEAQGVGRVYLNFLQQVAAQVRRHDRVMMFWGDIVMEHPELVAELPKDVIALEWGYEASHPFDRDGARFAEAGILFYVCPGTSSWNSLLGRTENALGNLRNAAENGKKHGARGYLITDWGDFGHWQPLPVSYAGYAYGAAAAWSVAASQALNLPALAETLNLFAFEDASGTMGRLALDLGNAYRLVNDHPSVNSSHMVRALYAPLAKIREGGWLPHTAGPVALNPDKVRAAMAESDRLKAKLDEARPADAQVLADYRMAVGLWQHGCKRILKAQDDGAYTKAELAAELRPLLTEFATCWLARSRPGGLGDSMARLVRMLAEYESRD